MRKEPELAAAFRKDTEAEMFLDRLNGILAPHEEQGYEDLPEAFPTLHVVGVPRSGTTLLSQLLCAHLDVGYVNNLIAAFWRAPVFGIKLSRKLLGERRTATYASRFGRTDEMVGPHEFGYFWSTHLQYEEMVEKDPSHEQSIDWPKLRRVLVNMASAFSAPVVFKPFLLGWHISKMQRVMPNTCFVRIRRDPVDNALSILRAREQYLGSRDKWLSLMPRACRELCGGPCWIQAAAQVFYLDQGLTDQIRRVDDRHVLEVTYDQLCRDPGGIVVRAKHLLRRHGSDVRQLSDPPDSFVKTPGWHGVSDESVRRVRDAVGAYFGSAHKAA